MLTGGLRRRGRPMLEYRLRCAWAKFCLFRHALVDKHVDIKLRLRLLDAVVTPCALYGLTTAPLTKQDVEQLAVTQRKMIRLIVGYVKLPSDSWEDMYRRMRTRVDRALEKHQIRMWADTLQKNREQLSRQLSAGERCTLTCKIANWNPTAIRDEKLTSHPSRGRGRPLVAWMSR